MRKIVVIGAGQAGASLAVRLRSLGHDGSITLIGEEPVAPYQRPPLSKKYLLGEMTLERLYLRPESYYRESDIELRTSSAVVSIDRAGKRISVGSREVSYDCLALCTGAVPRGLPRSIGGALPGVHTVRSLADVDAMAPAFVEGARALIVGGGYIGLEAAAVAATSGMRVTLIEAAERILQRVAAQETSSYFRALHETHGVDIRERVSLERLTGEGRVTGAVLSDGAELKVDVVIVGIGVTPSTELAESAGLEIENGVWTDIQGRTSDPSIWAAGDCASFPYKGTRIRLESVQNAIDQAECVAANMLGSEEDYVPQPWFWSDQYDCKLQIAGLCTGYRRIVTRGAGHSVSFWYYADETLLAVDSMNDARAYMIGKRLLEMGKSPDRAVIANANVDLKPLLRG
ncbi:NAD(P)/FAD-dependent oxidoreductase [Achromobacter marplatensis]|uniref:NAD(P)/FAD-dependent oxidoreductase n=1 Tax=Achromobacter marplatensis TaxID=470868 RepID=UPI003CFD8391